MSHRIGDLTETIEGRTQSGSAPRMLALLDATHECGILTCSYARKGEIQAISHLCCPDVAAIYCLTIERPAEAAKTAGRHETELVWEVPSSGVAVLNGDDRHLRLSGDTWKPHRLRCSCGIAAQPSLLGRSMTLAGSGFWVDRCPKALHGEA